MVCHRDSFTFCLTGLLRHFRRYLTGYHDSSDRVRNNDDKDRLELKMSFAMKTRSGAEVNCHSFFSLTLQSHHTFTIPVVCLETALAEGRVCASLVAELSVLRVNQ
jgi:hypothetical protein